MNRRLSTPHPAALSLRFQDLRWLRHYLKMQLSAWLRRRRNQPPQADELLFVIPETARGWVLETICKNLLAQYPGPARLHYPAPFAPLPAATAYFFVHQNEAMAALARDPNVWRGRRLVHYTHPSHESKAVRAAEIVYALNHQTLVLTQNNRSRDDLIASGVRPERVLSFPIGADPERFRPQPRPQPRPGAGVVGLSCAYYPRKNPELMAAVVRALPELHFILIGKDWEQWDGFADLCTCPNFEYLTIPYADYPAQYARMDVFLSTSRLEGGPVPLIEAMMCNRVPVVSDTGFAADLIRHGENGYLFPVEATAPQVAALIRLALENRADIAATTGHLSWQAAARQLHRFATEPRP